MVLTSQHQVLCFGLVAAPSIISRATVNASSFIAQLSLLFNTLSVHLSLTHGVLSFLPIEPVAKHLRLPRQKG